MFGNSYGYGMPRMGYPPDFHQQRMMRHRYANEMARRQQEAMCMEERLYAQAYMPDRMLPPSMRPFPRPRHSRMPRLPYSRGPTHTHWTKQIIHDTIKKTQERLLSTQSSNDSTAKSVSSSSTNNDKEGGSEMDVDAPPVAIGPRIPAKQMWESAYRDVVSEEQEAKTLEKQPPAQKPKQAPQKSKKKQNFRNKKFKPYHKRKGKNNGTNAATDNGTETKDQNEDNSQKETSAHNENVTKFTTSSKPVNLSLAKLNESTELPTNTPECTKWGKDTGDRTVNTIHFCRLCSVRMTSLPNASQHYSGKSHAKRIRIVQRGHKPHRKPFAPTRFISGGTLGMQAKTIPTYSLTNYGYGTQSVATNSAVATHSVVQQAVPTYQQVADTLAAPGTSSINLKPNLPGNFANSMTPSGQYYCSTCNVVIEHAGKLNLHLQSKAHKQAKASG